MNFLGTILSLLSLLLSSSAKAADIQLTVAETAEGPVRFAAEEIRREAAAKGMTVGNDANLRIRHADGSTTPLWTSGKDTRAGKFTADEKFTDLTIRAVDASQVSK
jgi:hypothetical protein